MNLQRSAERMRENDLGIAKNARSSRHVKLETSRTNSKNRNTSLSSGSPYDPNGTAGTFGGFRHTN